MRAHKRNEYYGQGLDKRQARRFRRRVKGGTGFVPVPSGFKRKFKPVTYAYLGVGQSLKEDA